MKVDIKDLQLISLANVELPTWLSEFRRICRWYSREFSTPLDYVENDLSPEYILRHYYEDIFSNLKGSSADDAAERYERLKLTLMGEIDEEEEIKEDNEWADEILREIKNAQKQEKISKTVENPNINDEMDINVSGE